MNVGVRQLLVHTVGETESKIAQTQAIIQGAATAEALSALYAAPAALATTMSFGEAALAAPAEVEGAVVATKALSLFQAGGYTGDGAVDQIAGYVHAGEFVVPANRVRDIGLSRLSALAFGSNGGVRTGGISTQSGASQAGGTQNAQPQRNVSFHAHFGIDDVKKAVRDSDGDAYIINVMQKNRHLFGI